MVQKKKRYRATTRGRVIETIKSDEITLQELERDIREARTLLFIILAVTCGLFGLVLGMTLKLFL